MFTPARASSLNLALKQSIPPTDNLQFGVFGIFSVPALSVWALSVRRQIAPSARSVRSRWRCFLGAAFEHSYVRKNKRGG